MREFKEIEERNMKNSNLISEEMLKLTKRENARSLMSEKILLEASNCFHAGASGVKAIRHLRIVAFPIITATGDVSYAIDRSVQKHKVASLLNCSTDQVVFSEGDFTDREGNCKNKILACADSLTYKADIEKDWLKSIRFILKDAHLEALDGEKMDSLEAIGGNLYLSDKNIDAFQNGNFLPNLQHVGGKVLVNAKEYQVGYRK